MRSLVKKISVSGSKVNPILIEQDKVKWQEEKDNLLLSRQIPLGSNTEVSLFPPRKTENELGPPIPIPNMSAIRLTSRIWQKEPQSGNNITPELNLFCQAFCNGKPHKYVKEDSTKAYEESICYGTEDRNGLRSQMLLIDWEDIPSDVDCIFIGVLFPKNSAKLIRGDIWFSATGMLEMLPLEDIDENLWYRDAQKWPDWDRDSPIRAELAEKDMFRKEPEFFMPNSVYSTYLCDQELGYTQSYIWGKCYKGEDNCWEFKAIREAVDASTLDGVLGIMRDYLPNSYLSLGTMEKLQLKLRTADPLAKLSVVCYRYDRFGFLLKDPVLMEQKIRGQLDVSIDELKVDHTTSLWIVWTGTSETFVNLQIGEETPTEFMGTEECILLRFTCLGVGKPYSFPPPKPDKWIAVSMFLALDGVDAQQMISHYQPVAASLRVHVVNGIDFAIRSSPFVLIKFGPHTAKTDMQKKTKDPVWNFSETWTLDADWKTHPVVEFETFGKSVTGKSPMGMAIYELSSMRIPYSGFLRLRPTGSHATTKNIKGQIVVLIDIAPKDHSTTGEEEVKVE